MELFEQRNQRMHGTDPSDHRSESEHDRDRILYCSSFRRLAGITQVVAPIERHVVHNRLTHTLEVAQVARRLGEKLLLKNSQDVTARRNARVAADSVLGIDPDVLEAAALAHDLGHPPFGHVAEQVLNDLSTKSGLPEGFNGNAQSLRILSKLAARKPEFPGLNLTRATLNGVLKYPMMRQTSGQGRESWGVYGSEETTFQFARELFREISIRRSVEAELVDWSDDVAYAVHDLEDFYRVGLIPLDRISRDRGENPEAERAWSLIKGYLGRKPSKKFELHEVKTVFDRVVADLPFKEPYEGLVSQRTVIRSFTAGLIGLFINGISINPDAAPTDWVVRDRELELQVSVLKWLTWCYVIDNPSLATQQLGHRRLIGNLFETYLESAMNEELWHRFPRAQQERLRALVSDPEGVRDDMHLKEEKIRLVVDFIASMTEQQAIDLHHRITGVVLGSALDPIVT